MRQNIFKDNLRSLRESRGETQAQTASVLGLSRATYVNYELGRNDPNIDVLSNILTHFGVTYNQIMGIKENDVLLNIEGQPGKNRENVLQNVLPSVLLTGENDTFLADPGVNYGLSAEDARNAFRVAGERLVKAQQAYNRALLALVVRNSRDEADKPG